MSGAIPAAPGWILLVPREVSSQWLECDRYPVIAWRLGVDYTPLPITSAGDLTLEDTALDPRISGAVALLREAGFETCDSGDGEKTPEAGCTTDVPHVAIATTHERCMRDAQGIGAALQTVGVMVVPQGMGDPGRGACAIQISWAPGEPWMALVMGEGLLDIGGEA